MVIWYEIRVYTIEHVGIDEYISASCVHDVCEVKHGGIVPLDENGRRNAYGDRWQIHLIRSLMRENYGDSST